LKIAALGTLANRAKGVHYLSRQWWHSAISGEIEVIVAPHLLTEATCSTVSSAELPRAATLPVPADLPVTARRLRRGQPGARRQPFGRPRQLSAARYRGALHRSSGAADHREPIASKAALMWHGNRQRLEGKGR
jgi:hypothetical protein